jgi:hypothetical protein
VPLKVRAVDSVVAAMQKCAVAQEVSEMKWFGVPMTCGCDHLCPL